MLTVHGGVPTPASVRTNPGGASLPPAIELGEVARDLAEPGTILRMVALSAGTPGRIRQELAALGSDYGDLMPETEYQVRSILTRHDGEQET